MGLASALSTALTGLNAAETTIDVVGNNVANSNTVGFKASSAVFATQFLQTLSLGSGPTETRGGTNARQVGLGTKVAEITPDFTQGTIQISSNPLDLAVQGDGFFVVEGKQGEKLYTRNGQFKTNAQNELTNITGQRVLGFGVDDNFQIQATGLTSISIPLGSSAVAAATQNVTLEGTLTPTGDIGTTPGIIQSVVLSDGSLPFPDDLALSDITAISPPNVGSANAPAPSATAGSISAGTYRYKITYVDADGNEGPVSDSLSPITTTGVNGVDTSVQLSGMPSPTNPDFTNVRIYRTDATGAGEYYLAGSIGAAPDISDTAAPAANTTAGTIAAGTYRYKVAFVDALGNESLASTSLGPITTTGTAVTDQSVLLDDLPIADGVQFVDRRIYRTNATGTGNYYLVGNVGDATTQSFVDSDSDATIVGNGTLNTSTLSYLDNKSNAAIQVNGTLDDEALAVGNYGYYVTFYNTSTGLESRPTSLIGPEALSVGSSRVRIKNIPQPSTADFNAVRIYRSLSDSDVTYYRVAELTGGETSFIDNAADNDIEVVGNELNIDGPAISSGLLVTDLVRYDGTTYERLFREGTLSFTGRKGDRALETKTLEIDSTTTVQRLVTFMEEAFGIQEASGDAAFPIPGNAGGSISGSRLQFVSNMGTKNAVDVGLSGFQLEVDGALENVPLTFASTQEANGESAVTDFVVYDSLGIPLDVRLTMVMESRTSASTTYRWYANSPDNDPVSPSQNIAVGTGVVVFGSEGNVTSVSNSTVSIERRNVSSASPLEFELDFSEISGLAAESSAIAASRQDGSGAGVLASFVVSESGAIRGVFSNGITRDLGQIRLVRFANNAGLEQVGENLYNAGVNSGLPVEGNPGEQGIGTISAGAIELSNTDIGQSLIDLILASTQYRGGTRVVTAVQQLLDELLNLRR